MIDLIDWNRAPLAGHALVHEGRAHYADGSVVDGHGQGTSGQGHGKCQCGAISPKSGGRKYRRDWHAGHKTEVREEWNRGWKEGRY